MTPPATLLKQKSGQTLVAITRWSYVAKALLFGAAGVLAIRSSIGLSAEQPDRKKVLEVLFTQPLGQVLTFLIIVTLLGHTIWRVIELIKDPYKKGFGPYGILYKLTYLLTEVTRK